MAKIAGREVTKNTMVGVSLGSLALIVMSIWTALGIGRPLFAADLDRIEEKIDTYQTNTAVQIWNIRKAALQSEMREAKRDVRRNPEDDDAAEDVDEIKDDIEELDAKIECHRTEGCEVEAEL